MLIKEVSFIKKNHDNNEPFRYYITLEHIDKYYFVRASYSYKDEEKIPRNGFNKCYANINEGTNMFYSLYNEKIQRGYEPVLSKMNIDNTIKNKLDKIEFISI